MLPGRELDRKVAEKMGWYVPEPDAEVGIPDPEDGFTAYQEIPHFSTDIAAAMEAFSWLITGCMMKNKGQPFLGRDYSGFPAIAMWDTFKFYKTIGGQTFSHAICLAIIEL